MRYEQTRKKYWDKKLGDPLPVLPADERIYFDVPYVAREFAKYSHCGFDPEKKLWFTGIHNANLEGLCRVYDVHEATPAKARRLLEEKLRG